MAVGETNDCWGKTILTIGGCSYRDYGKKGDKKINFFDGLEAIWVLIKYRFYD